MKILTVVAVICLSSSAFAFYQQSDSTTTESARIDSLEKQYKLLLLEIDSLKKVFNESNPLTLLSEEYATDVDTSLIPEDQRSRRKQVDALLSIISKQPGQLHFNASANGILQGRINGDHSILSTGVGSINLYASAAFAKEAILFFDFEAIGGNGPNDYVHSISTLNGDAGSTQSADAIDRLYVNEAWVEFQSLNEIFTVTTGKIDLTNYFDINSAANDENSQFITGAFINSTAFAVPSSSAGIRLRTTFLGRFSIQFGFSKTENSGKAIFKDIYKIGSLGFKFLPFTDFESNINLFANSHPLANDGNGYGISIDQAIFGRFITFGRYAVNKDRLADWLGIKRSWSAGAQFKESFLNQIFNIGIAIGGTEPYDKSLLQEREFEIYFRQMLNQWVGVSLHVQHIEHAGGLENQYTLWGFRANINL